MEINKFVKEDGKAPIDGWLQNIKDRQAKARLLIRIDRLRLGLFGDCKSVGGGVQELRVPEGKGYRLYFGRVGDSVVLLLCGGSKASQSKDIKQAKAYWKLFNEGRTNG